jgi:signal transduction histidine kinase
VRLEPRSLDVASFLAGLVGASPDVEVQADSDIRADVDPLVLERILTNLVANARAYGKPPVTVRATRTDTLLTIEIEDSGTGVPMELVPRLFDRFVRGGEGHGSGLGLAIARAYTRAHGGDLRYARADRGARFEIVLPGA